MLEIKVVGQWFQQGLQENSQKLPPGLQGVNEYHSFSGCSKCEITPLILYFMQDVNTGDRIQYYRLFYYWVIDIPGDT